MDLFLVSLILHPLLILLCSFPESQADQDPINKYSEYLNTKDEKEDMKRRRKQVRVQPISLKPPPQDWPEPQMAPGDFIVAGQSEATSLSPLLAYQAKLEQEYEKQKQEKKQQEIELEKHDNTELASEFTSSEEDLHKLLDPDELLKHNKQLRPFVNQGKYNKSTSVQMVTKEQQGKEAKPAGISSLTALKAKTSVKKTRKKAKSVTLTMSTSRPRRGRKRKTVQKTDTEDHSLSEDLKGKRPRSHKSEVEQKPTKNKRKRVRGFTFAARKYEETYRTRTKDKNKPTIPKQTTDSSVTYSNLVPMESTSLSQKTVPTLVTIESTQPTQKIVAALNYKEGVETSTEQELYKDTNTKKHTSSTLSSAVTEIINESKRNTEVDKLETTKDEIREKRKEMRQEMEKVRKAEELEGSFTDSDSDWTTSEKTKVPIHLVTPRHALLGILKHKVVDFIDKILKDEQNIKDDEEKFHEKSLKSSTLKPSFNKS